MRETTKVLCEPILASRKAKQAPREHTTVLTKIKLAPHQCVNVVREAIKVPCERKITSSKVIWAAKSTGSSLDSDSCEGPRLSQLFAKLSLLVPRG